MKGLVLTVFTIFLTSFSWSQHHHHTVVDTVDHDSTYWEKGGVFGINLSQINFQHWAAGGISSLSGIGLLNMYINYDKHTMSWDNTIDIGFGQVRQGKKGRWFKSDDKIDLSTKFDFSHGKGVWKYWYYSLAASFRTEFANGYDLPFAPDSIRNKISGFMAPAYTMVTAGKDYRPNEHFDVSISPLSLKMTSVHDQRLANIGAFGVTPAEVDTVSGDTIAFGRRSRKEFGAAIKLVLHQKIMENIEINAKLELFENYLFNPENIDVNFELILAMKVNKYISVTLDMNLVYDNDINIAQDEDHDGVIDKVGPITQFKEILGVSFNYQF